jgi:hypothetical protein
MLHSVTGSMDENGPEETRLEIDSKSVQEQKDCEENEESFVLRIDKLVGSSVYTMFCYVSDKCNLLWSWIINESTQEQTQIKKKFQ